MSWRVSIIQKLVKYIDLYSFYPKLRRFYVKHLKNPAPLILDIGSNKGQTIDFFLGINKDSRIIGFEPNKQLFTELQRKYKRNKNIVIHNVGVSKKKGKLLFQENVLHETSTFENLNYDSEYLKKKARVLGVDPKDIVVDTYEVDVVDLNSFIEDQKIENIDVLKIDVEGHEYACLQGLFNASGKTIPIKFLQLESHFDDMYKVKTTEATIEALLDRFGFKDIYRIKNSIGDYEEVIYQKVK